MKDENTLLQAAKKLDQNALSMIFDSYAPAIYAYIFRFCHDPIDSDDMVGDVFAQLLQNLAAGRGPVTNLRSYLYRIAYHLVIERVRNHPQSVSLGLCAARSERMTDSPQQAQVEANALMDLFMRAINEELNDLERHVIILRFIEGFSLRETAGIMDKKLNHVKVLQSRGMAKLRRSIGLRFKGDWQALSSSQANS